MELADRPTQVVVGHARAEYGLFMLVDRGSKSPWITNPQPGEIFPPVESGIGFQSEASDFYPSVTVLTYELPAARLDGDWDAVVTAPLRLPTGSIVVRSIMGDIGARVEVPAGLWLARCQVRGRYKALRRWQAGELFFYGEEEWFIQMWPAASSSESSSDLPI